jgi:hypothetical protein
MYACSQGWWSMGHLDLSHNELTGAIPANIVGAANALSVLKLSANRLGGVLPASFSGLTKLSSLQLDHNTFNGTINDVPVGNTLDIMNLNDNMFSGSISDRFSRLQVLNATNNGFTGTMPRFGEQV